jgi:aspartate-semialdehyde dehydrogenase
MSSNLKSPAVSHVDPTRGGAFYRVAIVGAGSLQGKELSEVLNDRNFPSLDVKLLDDDESLGKLEARGDEVTFIQKVRADEFHNMDFTFFAADPESVRKSWKIARDAGSDIIDLTAALEDEPGAALRSPWIERQLAQPLVPELQPGPVS